MVICGISCCGFGLVWCLNSAEFIRIVYILLRENFIAAGDVTSRSVAGAVCVRVFGYVTGVFSVFRSIKMCIPMVLAALIDKY